MPPGAVSEAVDRRVAAEGAPDEMPPQGLSSMPPPKTLPQNRGKILLEYENNFKERILMRQY
jgi:hypothetical protein